MNSFFRLLCSMLILGLLGCQKGQQNILSHQNPEQCKAVCVQHFEYCRQNCSNNCPTCSAESQKKTAVDYINYLRERNIEGKMVMRELNSYRDPLKCRKVSCDCIADFTICNNSCAGVIKTRLQYVPYCV